MEITTARLKLDGLRANDAEALWRYRGDPDVARYQSWRPGSASDAMRFIDALASVQLNTPDTWFQYALRLRGGDRLVGDIGLHFPLDPDGPVEFGVTIAPAWQGRGLAIEALQAALQLLFRDLGKHRVVASVDPRNHASVALLRRLGMRQEAHFRASLRVDNEWVDDVIFAMLSSEWPSKSP